MAETVRELVNLFQFKIDTEALDKADKRVDQAAQNAAKALTVVNKTVETAVGAAARTWEVLDGKIRDSRGRFVKAGEAMEAAANKAATATSRLAEVIGAVPGELAAIDRQAEIMGKGFDAARAKAEALGTAIRNATRMGATSDTPGMAFLAAEYARSSKEASSHEGGHGFFGKLMHHMPLIGGFMGAQAAMTTMQVVEGGVENFADFQQQLQKAGAAMRDNQSQIDDLRHKALKWANQLRRAPTDIGETIMELAGQGFNDAAVSAMTPTAAKLQRAGMTDTRTADDILGSNTRAFYGDDASKAGHVGDVLAMVHDLGGIQIGELSESTKYASPAFAAMHQSIEGLGTLLALLGRAGIKSSMAGTASRTMLLRLAAPNPTLKSHLQMLGYGNELAKGEHTTLVKELGLHVEDSTTHRMRSVVDILRELVAKTKEMSDTKRAGIYKQLFGLESTTEAMAFANATEKQFEYVSSQVHNANGRLDGMYQTMNRGLIPSWQAFTGKLQIFGDTILEGASPGLERLLDDLGWVVDRATDLANWIGQVTDNGKRLEPVLVALRWALVALTPFFIAAAIGALPALIGVIADLISGPLMMAIGGATAAVWGFVAANAPIAAVVALVLALFLIFQDFYTYMNGGKSELSGWWDFWEQRGGDALYAIYQGFMGVGQAIMAIPQFLGDAGRGLVAFGANVVQLLGMAWHGITSGAAGAAASVVRVFSSGFASVYAAVSGWISKAIASVTGFGQHVAQVIATIPGLGGVLQAIAGGGAFANTTPAATAAHHAVTNVGGSHSYMNTNQITVTVPPGTTNAEAIGGHVGKAAGAGTEKAFGNLARAVPLPVW